MELVQMIQVRSISGGTVPSITVKLYGVDRGGDGPSAVASPLLLCLFVAE